MNKLRTCRILMIGNSYTYFNSLWDIFKNAGDSIGYDFQVDQVTKGGYYLHQHADPLDICGAQIERLLKDNSYDYVFLQENSTGPLLNFNQFLNAAGSLHRKIAHNGAKTVLYQTWARKLGSSTLSELGWTVEGMHKCLETAYRSAAKNLNAMVSPVGTVFSRMTSIHPEIELYDPDKTHPSPAGSYLAAICHLVTLTGIDPACIPYDYNLNSSTAEIIRQCIADIFKN